MQIKLEQQARDSLMSTCGLLDEKINEKCSKFDVNDMFCSLNGDISSLLKKKLSFQEKPNALIISKNDTFPTKTHGAGTQSPLVQLQEL